MGVHNRHMGGPVRARRWVAVCLIVALLVVPVMVYSQAVPAVAIWGVTTAGAAWTGLGELALSVRAALAAPAFYSAAKWLTATLVPAAASLAMPIAIGAGLLGGAALGAWMTAKGYEYLAGQWKTVVVPGGYQPTASSPTVGDIPIDRLNTSYKIAVDGYAPTAAIAQAMGYTSQLSLLILDGWDPAWQCWYNPALNEPSPVYRNHAIMVHSSVSNQPAVYGPVDTATVKTELDQDLVSSDPAVKAAAQAAVLAATQAITDAFNDARKSGLWPPAIPGSNPIPQELWDAWLDALEDGIDDTDKTDMAAEDTPTNYGKDATNPPVQQVGVS